tara:strand:- start:353 stop:571 length:219 start_codon:yes stop_codon:yes gene_type:complete
MSKIKEHYHEEIVHGQQNADHVTALLSRNTIVNIRLLIHLTTLNSKDGWSSFYLPKNKIKEIKALKNELDRL